MVIAIDIDHEQEFFEQLRKFAVKHDFKIQIDTRPPGLEGFYVNMYRDDIEISGMNPWVRGEYELSFYDADCNKPALETVLDDLVSDLKSFVIEVPGVKFSVEK